MVLTSNRFRTSGDHGSLAEAGRANLRALRPEADFVSDCNILLSLSVIGVKYIAYKSLFEKLVQSYGILL